MADLRRDMEFLKLSDNESVGSANVAKKEDTNNAIVSDHEDLEEEMDLEPGDVYVSTTSPTPFVPEEVCCGVR